MVRLKWYGLERETIFLFSRSMRADVCLVNTNRHRWADMLPYVSVDYSKELLRNHSALLYQST